MSEELVPTPRMKDVSPEYAEIMMLGNVLFMSGYFKDVRDQAQAVTKILFGRELGFSPIVSMGGIHIIEGKPALSSNLMATLIKRSGKYDYRVKSWSNTECVLMFRERAGDKWEEVGESSFTMADADMAGVTRKGGSWSKYPKAMLFARALSQGLRTYCPDVSASPIYVPEEMGAEVNGDGDVVTLPASARAVAPVAVTTAPIPVAPPKVSGPAKQAEAVTTITPLVKGTPSKPPKAAEPPNKHYPELPPEEVFETSHAEAVGRDGAGADATIDLPRQKALHRQFREAIVDATAQSHADAFLQDWLKHRGYTGPDGKGTTKTIPMILFDEVKADAVKWAATLK